MYSYQNLKNISYKEIAECFNKAFSDYVLPLQLTEEQLKERFIASCVNKELSYGAFYKNKLIGFIFNSSNIYNDKKVVFDVGTGIIPEHRGKGIFNELFLFAENELSKKDIERYYLETLQQNNRAIHLYKKYGFNIVRELYVLRSSINKKIYLKENLGIKCVPIINFMLDKVSHCIYLSPSYEHSTNILKINPELYNVAYIEREKITSFCIFSNKTGNILQMGYADIEELKIIVQYLVKKYNSIVVKNIDKNFPQILEMFYSLGFTEITRQYEMVKILK